MFDSKKPTALLLGRYQPFHDGHFALFKAALEKTGQVIIAVRNTGGTDDKNPFNFNDVRKGIDEKLVDYRGKYQIVLLPNITNIVYGRDVGYTFDKVELGADIESISATKIREEMKASGKL